ncbi:MAG: 2-succinyl-5-enolpyruvyl-6-hydroxy-3-cyclohexene-1-carboxylic-acid synthase [Solirubrobacteraceae bacterium]|nr:2-succinyl-5-enolpyruvyl-6-hydroxy-3-cyclohexene-1-carboxylic-acid synthase [Solirubrobacteraceae bacterium]
MTTTNDSHLLLRAFCDEMARCGISGAVTSPGSRSTPLVAALTADGGFPVYSQIDERSAGFFALGLAKATGRPALLACTSGTAAANYLPAVIEAYEARVPLIVCTSDRPPELRGIGSGQTIDQIKLYGDNVLSFTEVGVDRMTTHSARWIRSLACRAAWTSLGQRRGPVHLNFPFREPLLPELPLPDETPIEVGRSDRRPWTARVESFGDPQVAFEMLGPIVASAPKGIIVAGRVEGALNGPRLTAAAEAFSAASGWPILADPLSGARCSVNSIAHYDALLRAAPLALSAQPTTVLRFGDMPTSKPLRSWLEQLDAVQVLIDPEMAWQDPSQQIDLVLNAQPAAVLELLAADCAAGEPAWSAGWQQADAFADEAIDEVLGDRLSEPAVARQLGAQLPPDATLVVASSMPIRDVESFFPNRELPLRVLSNRGGNGIDGTIATAYGVAAVSDGPTVLMIGDVAFVHDIGSLINARRLGAPLTIVLIDNDGGGIFDFLEVSEHDSFYQQHVLTPSGLDVAGAATAFGLHLLEPTTLDEFSAALDYGVTSDGTQLIHLRTERAANVELHRELWNAVAVALAR